jgi:hypothetical protein
MTEIKLTKRYPQSRTEDITDAFMRGYQQGCEDGYKKKEFDRDGDCFGCKYIGIRYIEGATPRCEGCCRNYADGYVAEQTEPQTVETMSCQECRHFREGMPCRPYIVGLECNYEPKDEPQTERSE